MGFPSAGIATTPFVQLAAPGRAILDVDLDPVTLLAMGLIVVIAFGVGWIVRGRR